MWKAKDVIQGLTHSFMRRKLLEPTSCRFLVALENLWCEYDLQSSLRVATRDACSSQLHVPLNCKLSSTLLTKQRDRTKWNGRQYHIELSRNPDDASRRHVFSCALTP
mmetsp:Transcript_2232/g.5574  ORF Transcript_2232/g.5574 Transcript_2232/m.5574 type:complete len:108 (+) Transcript_2232:110-433(+)